MATTVQQSFLRLKSNLEITGLQTETVSTRQLRVRQVVEAGMQVSDTFLTGSYARHTMISPLKDADIDIFFVLDNAYYYRYNGQNGGPAGLLDYVRRTLLRTYTTTPSISRNGQAVTIRFTDFVVDVVVGFFRQGGGYLIPNSITKSWLSTDPKKHVELVSAANRSHNGNLIPIIKMLKAWNKSHGSFFRSFHIEVLALQIFANVTISDFPSGVRFFFDKAREAVKEKNPDPAGYGDDVGKYIGNAEQVRDAVSKLQLALNIALAAEQHNASGRNRDAIEQWRRLFPDHFPSYG
ncbi:nucleotidyltransferase [Sinorhizobium meliloti]|uniref:CBASS oligonucleotide cyclase n=1 Tax=Rhizobium meliloti TaxID=382 RepID=UPI000FDA9412|nr:CBASS oligonucleotide cyclase [Sinorhizobium meliloti]MDE3795831.1 nucleotidyltransferase [Sinorhizobium meliloti]RVK58239.1 nucleotidyltransferase [Sinorhizobium meliloti]